MVGLRTATSDQEWQNAAEVRVQLAGRHQLTMRITAGGSLLMPWKGDSSEDELATDMKAQTIVPLGPLIETLGYKMCWSKDECILISPEGKHIELQVQGGCPQLQEI